MTPEDVNEAVTLAEYTLLGDIFAAIVDATDDPAKITEGANLSLRQIDYALGVFLDVPGEDGIHQLSSHAGRRTHAGHREEEGPHRRRTDSLKTGS